MRVRDAWRAEPRIELLRMRRATPKSHIRACSGSEGMWSMRLHATTNVSLSRSAASAGMLTRLPK
ncbi:hypothetical protein ACFPRL_13535 [Pseudoclavibacter helvolus]